MRLIGEKLRSFTGRWTHQPRVVLLTLISLNLAVFVAQILLEAYQPGFVREYLGISDHGVRDAYTWQFVTSMFLHQGPWHFLGNLLILYFFGRDLEIILGHRHFLYLYIAGALGGELGHLFLMPSNCILFAASGGVAAILVAYTTILPELELGPTFLMTPLRLKAKHIGYGAGVIALLLLCVNRSGVVAHSACLGGCAVGWVYVHFLGFGYPSFWQRFLARRRAAAERYQQMDAEQFIVEEIDPLLDKISRRGLKSLTRSERRVLARARDKILEAELG
jgi:membrane associated rhomboid family serine protease